MYLTGTDATNSKAPNAELQTQRKRNTNVTATHGRTEPLALLCSWDAMGYDLSRQEHCSRRLRVHASNVVDWVVRTGMSEDVVLDAILK